MKDGLYTQIILRQPKLRQNGIYGCIIQLIKFQIKLKKKKYAWQKDHKENKTGTPEKYVPVKIKKMGLKKI